MIPALQRPRLDRHARGWLTGQLQLGPWVWPEDGDARQRAAALAPSGPPEPRPGQTVLVTVSPSTASLWVLHAASPAPWPSAVLGPRAREAWTTASSVLPRSVPLLWRSLQRAQQIPLEAAWLTSLAAEGAVEVRERVIDGVSFGLSLLLSMASLVFDRSLPGDLAASAELDASGRLGPVDGLERKLEVLMQHAPGVRRLLVAGSQAGAAARAARGAIGIVGADSAAEALGCVFGDDLSRLLLRAGHEPDQRRALVESFFELAMQGRAASVDWTPIAQASRMALDTWTELQDEEREPLQFACMVASRHQAASGPGALPGARWLSGLPAPVRIEVVAHTVQQSADRAEPAPQDAWALGQRHLVRGPEAFGPHLKLLGALGRLAAVTGRATEALEMQQEAADGLAERRAWGELSYPLAECFRLAGALGDAGAFLRAEQMLARWTGAAGPKAPGGCYVTLGRGRALVLLGRGTEAEPALRALRDDLSLPAHLRWSATRWLMRCSAAEERAELMQELVGAACEGREADVAARYVDLAQLDAASGDGGRGAAIVERMREREPGLMRNLCGAGACDAPGVARMHPY